MVEYVVKVIRMVVNNLLRVYVSCPSISEMLFLITKC